MPTRASEQAASEPSWIVAARGATQASAEQVRAAADELAKLPGDGAARATQLLNALAAEPPTAAGLRAAAARLDAALPGFVSPGPRPPGQDQGQRRLTRAALMLFHGRVHLAATQVAAQKEPQAAALELLRAVEVVHQALRGANANRGLEWETRVGLGSPLFDEAERARGADKGTGPAR